MNIEYHYPADLLQLLIETIPLLCKSKLDIFTFFASAGVSNNFLKDIKERVRQDRDSISKYEIVRIVLSRLNERGESALRERREILKRIVEWEDFSTCYPDNQEKAQFNVVRIQKLVGIKDAFTRINLEREAEKKQKQAETQARQEALQQRRTELAQVKKDFYSLFTPTNASNPQKRGKALEAVLNHLFKASDISVCEAFTITGTEGEGIVEQIDGVIEIDGQVYLVEMKWWNNPIGKPEVAQHLVRLYHRAEAQGIFISASDYTEAAVKECKDALQRRVIILCTLKEIVFLLEQEKPLKEFLKAKIHAAIAEKNPFYEPLSPI